MTKAFVGADRQGFLHRLGEPDRHWDVLVIGGGASGLGIALDAVSRGLRVLLLEQADFAKGTSSRSTKLVHGGVRYLAQGNIRLVREASVERGILHRNAPHLVKDLRFVVPVYTRFDKLKYYIGLKLYDWIAGSLSLGASFAVSAVETVRQMPGLRESRLCGSISYHDGQFDDSRLALNLAQTIAEQGGDIVNYVAVTGFIKDRQNMIKGVTATDRETGRMFNFQAGVVVNATGVFADAILQMDRPGTPPTIRPSQGIHLVVDRKFLPSAEALMIPRTSDGRVLFAVPWHQHLVIGTTDTPVDNASMEPHALEKEIEFILDTASQYLTTAPTIADVLSVYAGLRPLAAPTQEGSRTREISRSHKILRSSSGLYSMVGGKWTTYRKMGEDMLDRIVRDHHFTCGASATRALAIHGWRKDTDFGEPMYYYGSDLAAIAEMIASRPGDWVSEQMHIHAAQVEWAVDHELARNIEDFLARRTRVLFLDAREAIRIAPAVAAIMASRLGHDPQWQQEQIDSFRSVARGYLIEVPGT